MPIETVYFGLWNRYYRVSFAELIKACYGLPELHEESIRLSGSDIECKRVALHITDKIVCGFYQTGLEQSGFIWYNDTSISFKIDKLQQIQQLLDKSLNFLETFAKS